MLPRRATHARRSASALAALAVSAALLTSCSTAPPAPGAERGEHSLRVVATTTQLTDLTREIGGEGIQVTGLLPLGGSAHHFDPSPAELLALGEADVLVMNGAGLETFLDDAIDASGFDGTVIVASDGIDLEEAREITAEGEREAAGRAGEPGQAHEHEQGDEHDREHAHEDEHGEVNPHLWTSPRYAADMVREIARGLAAADPEAAAGISDRADALVERLSELEGWIHEQFAAVPEADRVLVSGHDSLRYYLHDFGIAFAGSVLPSFEDNAEPSAVEVDALVARIRELGVRAVFVESSLSPKLARTIAEEAGVTVVDTDALYADSLGPEGSGAEHYIDATAHNTRVILEAWGVTPAPLPERLR